MGPYLLGLRLSGRRVLVVGGGRVAQRRVPALLEAGAEVTVVSPGVTPALDDLIAAGRVTWHARPYEVGDCDGAWLVQACTDDRSVNTAVAAEAEAKRVWCVRADDKDASAAWTPATGRVDEIGVAITAGGDPRRAAGIRDAVVEALRDGTVDARRNRTKPVGVALVGGGPGDPGLITVRGRQLLSQADVVVADRLAPRALLDELAPDVELIDAAKVPYGRSLSQETINELLVDRARQGKFVVRLKGGDSFVFGRGGEEMIACAEAGIPVLVVPGLTSAVAVPAAAGVPVTHRGVSQEFHVISVHVAPDDPRSTVDWPGLARSQGTLVLLMAVERLAKVAEALVRDGRSPETPVMVVQDGTLPTQRAVTASLSTVADRVSAAGIRPPAIVIVGDVVRVGQEVEMVRAERLP
ncbi:uroporphyrinogen-III C-methyltransferase [Nonomuraea gerenzanensis]|uniref:Siroheme synthase / Precorrin-2 oxidase / Sirohydrochlorin ferrochelatase / Uroporphyrinogen-III methyltransferase n=1 Tax=Nonomuraea gerenzanensis TaxID=93944 RepID=A0A1M4EMA7_9ACTN|nr:uroporphyrinogen-III C-methyltransferase [Nonomuraea gerenzanensis]UBU11229.1 uroporphyrinogen-III C-methyltransferase [Nonomuraea gerenzanensis]SBO99703.1 Siroheme synthase / Precorrin-2 oxidase / Sirohydrochlorin ferrochelatase / Uroporphyrinogen-III methyltransferase [Nonomuraea gerenzanensis]